MQHDQPHPMAGKIAIVRHKMVDHMPSRETAYIVIDWLDRLERDLPSGDSLISERIYLARAEFVGLPDDDRIVLGNKLDGSDHAIFHETEIECDQDHPDFKLYQGTSILATTEGEGADAS